MLFPLSLARFRRSSKANAAASVIQRSYNVHAPVAIWHAGYAESVCHRQSPSETTSTTVGHVVGAHDLVGLSE